MDINYLWNNGTEAEWKETLDKYCTLIDNKHMFIEKELAHLNYRDVKNMSAEEFYDFLHNKYFFWKYTAANRLATTRMHLRKYKEKGLMDELANIHKEIFACDVNNVKLTLETVTKIKGLGYAGASGLLALMYPEKYGTIDQFVVLALRKINDLPEKDLLEQMDPNGLKAQDGVILIDIYRKKAEELNKKFNSDFWTPRKIDQVLWCVGR